MAKERRRFRHNTIAVIYDFDGTLTPQPMQEYTVLPKLGVSPKKFWETVIGGWGLALLTLSVLLLSAAGIYALMSFTVTQRRREIGIRAALGAEPLRLLASIFARALRQLTIGVAVGIGVAALLDWGTAGEFTGGEGAVLLAGVAAFMIIVGLLAAVGPARRGLRIQPTEALRADG